jgi:hypothetical protein
MNLYVSQIKVETNFTFNSTVASNKTKIQKTFDPLKASIDEISKNGLVKITFNKPIDYDLLNNALNNKDMNNKTLKLSIIPGSESDISKLNFYWSTLSFSDGILKLYLKFDNPTSISSTDVSR